MIVKAKFKVDAVIKRQHGETVTLGAVTGGSEENKSFSKYTPSGSIEMTVTNENLYGHFTPGKEYYVDIYEQAEPEREADAENSQSDAVSQ